SAAFITLLTEPSASVGLNKMALYPEVMAFSKWSFSKAVLFCESNMWASYPKDSASEAAASANSTNQGLFNVETTIAIFSFESFDISPAHPVKQAMQKIMNAVIFWV